MFDRARETFLLDESSYIRYGLDCMALAEHPLAKSCIFDERELVERLQLEWASGEFSMELLKCPREVIGASVELRNCLKSYAVAISKWDEDAILLMKKGGNTVAAMKVNADLVVSDAHGKCNKSIEALDDLNAVFEMWMQARSLRRERQDDF